MNVAIAIARAGRRVPRRKGTIQNAVNAPSLSPEVLQVLRPYLRLAEKLGSLARAARSTEPPTEITVEYAGDGGGARR